MKMTSNGRRPPMEDVLQWKTSSNESDLQWKTTCNGRQPTMEDVFKISYGEYLSNHSMDCDLWVLRGILEENSEEILSVALLSPACLIFLLMKVTGFHIICFLLSTVNYNWWSHCFNRNYASSFLLVIFALFPLPSYSKYSSMFSGSKLKEPLLIHQTDGQSQPYIRIGILPYTGLEFVCISWHLLSGISPPLQMSRSFILMYYIFMHSWLNINKKMFVAKYGLIHLVATNSCLWIRGLLKRHCRILGVW